MRSIPNPSNPDAEVQVRNYRNIWFGMQLTSWVIMGVGILSGSVKDVWGFFTIQEGNPFVLAFVGWGIVLGLSLAYWVFTGGAKRAIELRLMEQLGFAQTVVTERGVKFLAVASVLASIGFILSCFIVGGGSGKTAAFIGAGQTPTNIISADGYRVAYDLSQAGFGNWTFPAFGLIFVAVGIAFVYFRNDISFKGPAFMRRIFPFAWLGFAIIWTSIAFLGTYSSYRHLTDMVADGHMQVVEGVITDFVPMPVSGHAMEKFCVQQVCFEYSDFVINGGFNNTTSHGGPIQGGLSVRIGYVDKVIVKLEIAQK